MRDSLEIIRELGVPVKQIRASGGGSKSPLWRQIQADVFGQKVVTINAEEGPAYGVALLAAVGAGAYKTIEEACAATIRVVKETPVNRRRQEALRPRLSGVPGPVSVAEGAVQGDRGARRLVARPFRLNLVRTADPTGRVRCADRAGLVRAPS